MVSVYIHPIRTMAEKKNNPKIVVSRVDQDGAPTRREVSIEEETRRIQIQTQNQMAQRSVVSEVAL